MNSSSSDMSWFKQIYIKIQSNAQQYGVDLKYETFEKIKETVVDLSIIHEKLKVKNDEWINFLTVTGLFNKLAYDLDNFSERTRDIEIGDVIDMLLTHNKMMRLINAKFPQKARRLFGILENSLAEIHKLFTIEDRLQSAIYTSEPPNYEIEDVLFLLISKPVDLITHMNMFGELFLLRRQRSEIVKIWTKTRILIDVLDDFEDFAEDISRKNPRSIFAFLYLISDSNDRRLLRDWLNLGKVKKKSEFCAIWNKASDKILHEIRFLAEPLKPRSKKDSISSFLECRYESLRNLVLTELHYCPLAIECSAYHSLYANDLVERKDF